MKKAIILQHGGGELANQLWNYMSIYAYCLKEGSVCENPSFFEYAHFFDIPPVKSRILYYIFFYPFRKNADRRYALRTRFFRIMYKMYVLYIHATKRGSILSSVNSKNIPFYLPPTEHLANNNDVLYFEGWLFRNPVGIREYRNKIIQYFAPTKSVQQKNTSFITPLKQHYSHVVGVHLRQGDYAKFKNGKYLLENSRVHEVLQEYLKEKSKDSREVVFVITSDGSVDPSDFPGLTIVRANGNAVEDLFTLATTDVVIGSDSSYGNIASYFGNIPHIVITKEPMDWEYYRGKTTYFPTKYCTMVQY